MQTTLLVLQIISAILLMIAVLVQEKGDGIGEALGGTGGASSFQTTKRGAEKVLAQATVVLVVLFTGLSLALNFV